jgi:hypothetical protein
LSAARVGVMTAKARSSRERVWIMVFIVLYCSGSSRFGLYNRDWNDIL